MDINCFETLFRQINTSYPQKYYLLVFILSILVFYFKIFQKPKKKNDFR